MVLAHLGEVQSCPCQGASDQLLWKWDTNTDSRSPGWGRGLKPWGLHLSVPIQQASAIVTKILLDRVSMQCNGFVLVLSEIKAYFWLLNVGLLQRLHPSIVPQNCTSPFVARAAIPKLILETVYRATTAFGCSWDLGAVFVLFSCSAVAQSNVCSHGQHTANWRELQ